MDGENVLLRCYSDPATAIVGCLVANPQRDENQSVICNTPCTMAVQLGPGNTKYRRQKEAVRPP
jgi:hypothetical protein